VYGGARTGGGKVFPDGSSKVFPEKFDTPVGKVGNMVKVWARMYEPPADGRSPTPLNKFVTITGRKWTSHEYFTLCFQAVVPVHVYVYDVDRSKAETHTQLFPDDGFPETRKVLPVGKEYEMPYPIRMKASPGNEEVEVSFIFADDMTPFE